MENPVHPLSDLWSRMVVDLFHARSLISRQLLYEKDTSVCAIDIFKKKM